MVIRERKTFRDILKDYFLYYALIPGFMIVAVILSFIFLFQRYQFQKEITAAGTETAGRLNLAFLEQERFMREFAASGELTEFLLTGNDLNNVYELFYHFNNQAELKAILNILDSNGQIISASQSLNPEQPFSVYNISVRMKRNYPGILTESNVLQYYKDTSVYTMGTAVEYDGNIIGYVMLQTLDDSLLYFMKSNGTYIGIITDRFDRVIASHNSGSYKLKERFEPEIIRNIAYLDRQPYFITRSRLENYDIQVYTAGLWGTFQNSYVIITLFAASILLLLFLLMNNMSHRMSKKITEPINRLIEAIDHLKNGEMSYKADEESFEEFYILINEYNDMLEKLKLSIKKNEELSQLNREVEIKHLEAQFNPHFLLNTLEMLRYTAAMGEGASEQIILSLSKLLRYSLYHGSESVRLGDDMELLEDYLRLNRIRLGEAFTYDINYSPDLKDITIPKLLIQPLLENSIKHGYQGTGQFYICVTAIQEDYDLFIDVEDNGAGLEDEERDRLWEVLYSREKNTGVHIGLINVHRRAEMLYGEGCGIICLDGSDGFRVRIKLKMPQDRQEE